MPDAVNFAVDYRREFHKFRASVSIPDDKASGGQEGRGGGRRRAEGWIKDTAKLDCSPVQWNPLHALMHSCASRMWEYAGNENTHRNHCGYI